MDPIKQITALMTKAELLQARAEALLARCPPHLRRNLSYCVPDEGFGFGPSTRRLTAELATASQPVGDRRS
ncbi:hypothetical protein [Roseisalinus antarcticus]|uniref:Uncharacterized protein n=1 Tax=Roseisalinus antarcticus TaxID=254357 RepID=A0A1Y5T0T1_9RHOB|nr:hypothetical protein [Roseisalinus antarcticus]SLN51448.1 hypothetical protein ROA7023_02256 [Roseisalinus antarcticus]